MRGLYLFELGLLVFEHDVYLSKLDLSVFELGLSLFKAADSSACWNQKPTYKDIQATTVESPLDTCLEV